MRTIHSLVGVIIGILELVPSNLELTGDIIKVYD